MTKSSSSSNKTTSTSQISQIVIPHTLPPYQLEQPADYKSISQIVDGMIQVVCIPSQHHPMFGKISGGNLYLNEEGKLRGLPPNIIATILAATLGVGLSPDDIICGQVVLLGPTDPKGFDTSVDPKVWSAVTYTTVLAAAIRNTAAILR